MNPDAMRYRKVTAIIDGTNLKTIEAKLRRIGLQGVTVSRVKGWGSYKNFFRSDWKAPHARLEMYVEATQVDDIIAALEPETDEPHLGIVAVLPVEKIVHLGARAGEKR